MEYLYTNLPRYVTVTPRSAFANSVVQPGSLLLFSEDGTTRTAKLPDGSFVKVGGTDVSDTTATAADVLAGKDFHLANGSKTTGTIQTVTASQSGNVVTVPAGYIAAAQTLTVGTAKAAATYTPTTSDQTITAGQYLTGDQTIKGDANLLPENIVQGVSIFGVTGTASGGADVTLGVVDAQGKFQAFSFSGTTPTDSGTPETVTNYKTWNSTLPAPAPQDSLIGALIDRSITSVTIPSGVTSIGHNAFSCCSSLTSVTIPSSVTSIGQNAFFSCTSLTSVTIPSSVTSIGPSAFHGCSSLTSVTIPSSVTSIDYNAFNFCSSITSVTIPSSVTSIGSNAFSNCTLLTDIYCGFAEGSVSGAPWGATGATIHYNSSGPE